MSKLFAFINLGAFLGWLGQAVHYIITGITPSKDTIIVAFVLSAMWFVLGFLGNLFGIEEE